MSVLDFANESTVRSTTANTAAAQRPKAKLWLNIGFEINGKFVNLPVGIPLDTMEPVQARGQNADWVAFQSARNAFLKKLQSAGDALQPGAEMSVNGLQVRIRHVANELSVPTEDNAYQADMDTLFTTTVIEAPVQTEAAE
jgi:hypothetical protein